MKFWSTRRLRNKNKGGYQPTTNPEPVNPPKGRSGVYKPEGSLDTSNPPSTPYTDKVNEVIEEAKLQVFGDLFGIPILANKDIPQGCYLFVKNGEAREVVDLINENDLLRRALQLATEDYYHLVRGSCSDMTPESIKQAWLDMAETRRKKQP